MQQEKINSVLQAAENVPPLIHNPWRTVAICGWMKHDLLMLRFLKSSIHKRENWKKKKRNHQLKNRTDIRCWTKMKHTRSRNLLRIILQNVCYTAESNGQTCAHDIHIWLYEWCRQNCQLFVSAYWILLFIQQANTSRNSIIDYFPLQCCNNNNFKCLFKKKPTVFNIFFINSTIFSRSDIFLGYR